MCSVLYVLIHVCMCYTISWKKLITCDSTASLISLYLSISNYYRNIIVRYSSMEESLLKEIRYLTHLIEHHKMKSSEKCCVEKSVLDQYLNLTRLSKLPKPSDCTGNTLSTNVHINPNFRPQTTAIHINPKLRVKPSVHVNPKIMKSIINTNKITENTSNKNLENDSTSNIKASVKDENSVKKSVYVNPKLMKKLSSSVQSKSVEQKKVTTQNVTRPSCSRLKFVKSTNPSKPVNSQTKTSNSNILILSQRKLIRVKRGSKKASSAQVELSRIKKSPNLLRTLKSTCLKTTKTKIINVAQSVDKNSKFRSIVKPKINKYRIDRTTQGTVNVKRQLSTDRKKTVNKKMELITIGGIVYKSSKNHLVRKSYGTIRKRVTNTKSDKFIIATNGKKLCRIKSAKESSGNTKISNVINATKLLSQRTMYKNNISNKVKQKSIQILRNKMQKNNQPCLIFQRFGYCSNHEKGICLKRHDKKQISLCKKFLQGNCLLDKCPLSHDVGPEKMPTCKYFLEGCCTKDGCPYRHIKVSSSTPICIEFLQGYCAKGHECKQRHENLCPEFEKSGRCSKGKHCPYPHKSHSSPKKQCHLGQKNVPNRASEPASKDIPNNDNRLRYYEQTDDSLSKSFDKRKESILKKLKLMRSVETARSNTSNELSNDDINSELIENICESEATCDSKIFKRPPIGSLPAYIPIN